MELILANGQLYSEKGKVQAVTGQIDAATGSIQFRATFANSKGLLANGNSGKVRIPQVYENALVLPEMSVFERQGSSYVYMVSGDTARQTKVMILDKAQNLVVAESGVKTGDLVITQGTAGLRDKTPVKPKKQDLDQLLNDLKPVF